MEMTWKTSLIGVPFGGGKSGICYDPAQIKPTEKEVLIRAFARGVRRHIGPELYVPAPDMGTNERDMGHISDCISYSEGTSIPGGCFVTGKPLVIGGIVGRREATGNGVVATIIAACGHLESRFVEAASGVQGFGNVGSVAALAIASAGPRSWGSRHRRRNFPQRGPRHAETGRLCREHRRREGFLGRRRRPARRRARSRLRRADSGGRRLGDHRQETPAAFARS